MYDAHRVSLPVHRLKQVSDRDTIDSLFHLFETKVFDSHFSDYFHLLECIVDTRYISFVELHQKIQSISQIFSAHPDVFQPNQNIILHFLLKFSCIENRSSTYTENKLYTHTDVQREYQKTLKDLDQKSITIQQKSIYSTDLKKFN